MDDVPAVQNRRYLYEWGNNEWGNRGTPTYYGPVHSTFLDFYPSPSSMTKFRLKSDQ
jgi:hypothetical protein